MIFLMPWKIFKIMKIMIQIIINNKIQHLVIKVDLHLRKLKIQIYLYRPSIINDDRFNFIFNRDKKEIL